jgi:hypothetical protein
MLRRRVVVLISLLRFGRVRSVACLLLNQVGAGTLPSY